VGRVERTGYHDSSSETWAHTESPTERWTGNTQRAQGKGGATHTGEVCVVPRRAKGWRDESTMTGSSERWAHTTKRAQRKRWTGSYKELKRKDGWAHTHTHRERAQGKGCRESTLRISSRLP